MTRQYIGARYVPILMGEYDPTINYEPLSIVLYNNNSYTSKKDVPAGTLPSDNEYWALTSNFSSQLQELINKFPVSTENIDNLSVTDEKIADNSVKISKLSEDNRRLLNNANYEKVATIGVLQSIAFNGFYFFAVKSGVVDVYDTDFNLVATHNVTTGHGNNAQIIGNVLYIFDYDSIIIYKYTINGSNISDAGQITCYNTPNNYVINNICTVISSGNNLYAVIHGGHYNTENWYVYAIKNNVMYFVASFKSDPLLSYGQDSDWFDVTSSGRGLCVTISNNEQFNRIRFNINSAFNGCSHGYYEITDLPYEAEGCCIVNNDLFFTISNGDVYAIRNFVNNYVDIVHLSGNYQNSDAITMIGNCCPYSVEYVNSLPHKLNVATIPFTDYRMHLFGSAGGAGLFTCISWNSGFNIILNNISGNFLFNGYIRAGLEEGGDVFDPFKTFEFSSCSIVATDLRDGSVSKTTNISTGSGLSSDALAALKSIRYGFADRNILNPISNRAIKTSAVI